MSASSIPVAKSIACEAPCDLGCVILEDIRLRFALSEKEVGCACFRLDEDTVREDIRGSESRGPSRRDVNSDLIVSTYMCVCV